MQSTARARVWKALFTTLTDRFSTMMPQQVSTGIPVQTSMCLEMMFIAFRTLSSMSSEVDGDRWAIGDVGGEGLEVCML